MVHLMHKNIKYTKFRMKGIPIDIKDLIKKNTHLWQSIGQTSIMK